MTLFEAVAPQVDCFSACLERYCNGDRDQKTLHILGN